MLKLSIILLLICTGCISSEPEVESGPKGAKGSQGEQGLKGDTGAAGTNGTYSSVSIPSLDTCEEIVTGIYYGSRTTAKPEEIWVYTTNDCSNGVSWKLKSDRSIWPDPNQSYVFLLTGSGSGGTMQVKIMTFTEE